MATVVNIAFQNNNTGFPLSGWNLAEEDAIPVAPANWIADLNDDGGSATGWALYIVDDNVTGLATSVVDQERRGVPETCWDQVIYSNETGHEFRFTGLTSGDSYSLKICGAMCNSSRDSRFTVEGTTLDYDNSTSACDTWDPPDGVVFSGTVPGDGIIDCKFEAVSTFGYMSWAILTITEAAGGSALPLLNAYYHG